MRAEASAFKVLLRDGGKEYEEWKEMLVLYNNLSIYNFKVCRVYISAREMKHCSLT